MKIKAKFFIQSHYLWIIALLVVVAVFLTLVLYLKGHDWKILLSVLGGLLSSIYFVQKQQLDEANLFKDLFVEFNRRYDRLNGRLNDIVKKSNGGVEFTGNEINTLYDYFNLSGEEYLFYRKGYIYPEVWRSWVKGMRFYYENERIQKLWDKELSTESYYGFDIRKEISKLL